MDIFLEISLILIFTTAVAGLLRILKQPLILGYILTGLLVGPYFLNLVKDTETLDTFSTMGISVLLFIVGINLSPKVIREVGKVALMCGLGQIIITTLVGFIITHSLGYNVVTSLYVAAALTFSSTIIILKLLSDKKDLDKLYAKIAVGILLIQDIVASILFAVIAAFSKGNTGPLVAIVLLGKAVLLATILILISKYILMYLNDFLSQSQEYLFLFTIGWGFGIACLFSVLGLSIEIGALVAGVSISIAPYAQEASSKLRPLRDFFIIMFFILLGTTLALDGSLNLILHAGILSTFVLVGNPLIVMILVGLLGYKRRVGFLTGLTMAQISEFSLILIVMGIKLGHLNQSILSLVTLVGLVTIAGSTYLILYAEKLYILVAKYLGFFERKVTVEEQQTTEQYHTILFGCNRVGYDFIQEFKDVAGGFLAIDYNPNVIHELQDAGIECKFGDAEDGEFLNELNLKDTKLIISTIPEFEINLFLLKRIRQLNHKNIVIMISYSIDEAITLYDHGASYIILPHFIGGHFAATLASGSGLDIEKLENTRIKHIHYLHKRKAVGHEHPKWEFMQ